MGIINREYLAEGFSANDKITRDLSLLISNDGFSFAIFNQEEELVALRSYRGIALADDQSAGSMVTNCLETISKDPFLKSIFRNVKIAMDEGQHALVPEKLFDKRYPEKYLDVEHELVPDQLIWVDKVPTLEGRNIHFVQESFQKQLATYFPGAVFKHRTTALITHFSKMSKDKKGPQLFAHVDARKVFMFYFLDGKLNHTNEFEFPTPNDFLYFVLLNYKECELDPEKTPLLLSGLLDNKSQVYDKLYRYIKKMHWTTFASSLKLGDYAAYYPLHYDLELFALQLCE